MVGSKNKNGGHKAGAEKGSLGNERRWVKGERTELSSVNRQCESMIFPQETVGIVGLWS